MIVKLKKLSENAVIPSRSKRHDAGFDFTCTDESLDLTTRTLTYKLGWAIEIPPGYVGLMFPRSSIADKDISLTNSVGVIDAGYRGELMAKFKSTVPMRAKKYEVGERIIQLIVLPIPEVELQVVDELSKSERGEGGFGSSNK